VPSGTSGRTRPDSGTWIALRRPLFLALVRGCGFTVLAAGVLTLRIAVSAMLYWAFVPLTEALSLLIVTQRLRRGSARAGRPTSTTASSVSCRVQGVVRRFAPCCCNACSPGRPCWSYFAVPAPRAFLTELTEVVKEVL